MLVRLLVTCARRALHCLEFVGRSVFTQSLDAFNQLADRAVIVRYELRPACGSRGHGGCRAGTSRADAVGRTSL